MNQELCLKHRSTIRRASRLGRCRRGFTLMELVLAVSVIGIFGILYAQVFSSTTTITRTAPHEDAVAARIDMAINILRRDVWHARQIDITDPHTAIIRTESDGVVTWTLSDEGRLTRTLVSPVIGSRSGADSEPTRVDQWEGMESIRGIAASPSGLTLTLRERWINADSQVAITSQVLAAGRAAP